MMEGGADAAGDGVGSHPLHPPIQHCIRSLSSDANLLNERVNEWAQRRGVPVLSLWHRGRERGDAHVALSSNYTRRTGALDCTHFCEPSAYLAEAAADHASVMLSQIVPAAEAQVL